MAPPLRAKAVWSIHDRHDAIHDDPCFFDVTQSKA
jgi:hypothetical protein